MLLLEATKATEVGREKSQKSFFRMMQHLFGLHQSFHMRLREEVHHMHDTNYREEYNTVDLENSCP